MPACEPLWKWIGLDISSLSKREMILLEGELFLYVCEELKEVFRQQYKDYLALMKLTTKMENLMLDVRLAQLIIRDILTTKEYDSKGIACYTNSYEEVIDDILKGCNPNPSGMLLRKLIELHRFVRAAVYEMIKKKIVMNIFKKNEIESFSMNLNLINED